MSYIISMLLATILLVTALPAQAVSLLRDPDIERGLRELSHPILTAAGLSPSRVRILIVDEASLNAFVLDQNHIFLHAGLVMKLDSAAQLQAVIAHEAAHIANGHIARRWASYRRSGGATAFGVLLAVAAVAATGDGALAAGVAYGTSGSARGVFLAHSRAEESAADSAALRYMQRARIDPRAMAKVLDSFRGQEALSAAWQDPYTRSHPLTRDRLRTVKAFAATSPEYPTDPNAAYWFARLQGKLSAFKRSPTWTLRQATGDSDVDLMRRAVALHRQSKTAKALQTMAALARLRPRDPYVHELWGQLLLENRKTAQAVRAYRRAVALAPNDSLILGSLGRALLALDTTRSNAEALRVLEKARLTDNRDSRILRNLGLAYARAGQAGKAALAAADLALLRGRVRNAITQAKRAEALLPRGSAAWQRAQDILQVGR